MKYKYKKEDFFELCQQIIKYTNDSGKIPVIVTSRRTKKSHELLIKDYLQDYLDDKSVWFHSGLGRINLLNVFKLVDEIFVTEDSSSMISESISSGLNVFTIAAIAYDIALTVELHALVRAGENIVNRFERSSLLRDWGLTVREGLRKASQKLKVL